MIDSNTLEKELKERKFHNKYIFCGDNEKTIKDTIKKIKKIAIDENFVELNYSEFDGISVTVSDIVNACETLPFMNDKKVVVIYRSNFLKDQCDKSEESKYKEIKKYLADIPKECILIMYYIFESNREKESYKLKSLNKIAHIVKFEKLKGKSLQKKVKDLFDKRKTNISTAELTMFCNAVDSNLDVIENEVEKLCCYTMGREITRRDIENIISHKSENDIFNLVDYISQKRPEMVIDILDELIFKGEAITGILRMIERQFKLLLNIKMGIKEGKTKDILSRELKLHPYICEKMMVQSKKFTLRSIINNIEMCLETEKRLKSTTINSKTEMELLLINITLK